MYIITPHIANGRLEKLATFFTTRKALTLSQLCVYLCRLFFKCGNIKFVKLNFHCILTVHATFYVQ